MSPTLSTTDILAVMCGVLFPFWPFLILSPLRKELIQAATTNLFQPIITQGLVNFVLDYRGVDSNLEDHRITLSRKEFIIGPRPGFPVKERIYISKAPVSTEVHLQILADLEKSLTDKH